MNTVRVTYEQLARPWTQEQLADRYDEARRPANQPSHSDPEERAQTPVAELAGAIPPLAALNVAIHVIHVLPDPGDRDLLDQLLVSAEKNADVALRRIHRALELDGVPHGYAADEWLPSVYAVAGGMLESARFDSEPPSLVAGANAAVRWLSEAIADADGDAPDTTAALVDGLGRILALDVFSVVARRVLYELNP